MARERLTDFKTQIVSFGCLITRLFKIKYFRVGLQNITIVCYCCLKLLKAAWPMKGLNQVRKIFYLIVQTAKAPAFENLLDFKLATLLCLLRCSFIFLSSLGKHLNIPEENQVQVSLHYHLFLSYCFHFSQKSLILLSLPSDSQLDPHHLIRHLIRMLNLHLIHFLTFFGTFLISLNLHDSHDSK